MPRNIVVLILVAAISMGVGAGAGILGYVWTVGGSGEPSATISAPTLDINARPTLNPTQINVILTQSAQLKTQVADLEATIDALSAATPAP